MKTGLISLLGALTVGAVALSSQISQAGNPFLRVLNTSTNNSSSQQNRIEYTQGGAYGFATNYPKSLRIYDAVTTNTTVPVNTNIDTTLTANLAYTTSTVNRAENTLKFKFFNSSGASTSSDSTFPSNILITAQLLIGQNNYTNFDIIKLVHDAASPTFDGGISLPSINTNGPNPYATLKIRFAPKETSQPKLENISNGQVRVDAVLPGSSISLDSTANLGTQTFSSAQTNYVPVTPNNFGSTTSTTFTNIDFSLPKNFFRAKVN